MESTNHARLLKFEAEWCSPCKYMKPIVDSVLNDYEDVDLVVIDIDEEAAQEAVVKFNIRSIPTLVLLDANGKPIDTLIGTATEDKLRKFLSNR